MVGMLSKPMVTTVAPTMPVEAANIMPTKITESPSPPRTGPNRRAMVSSSCSATFERSSIIPMNTNNGTATRTWFTMMPK